MAKETNVDENYQAFKEWRANNDPVSDGTWLGFSHGRLVATSPERTKMIADLAEYRGRRRQEEKKKGISLNDSPFITHITKSNNSFPYTQS